MRPARHPVAARHRARHRTAVIRPRAGRPGAERPLVRRAPRRSHPFPPRAQPRYRCSGARHHPGRRPAQHPVLARHRWPRRGVAIPPPQAPHPAHRLSKPAVPIPLAAPYSPARRCAAANPPVPDRIRRPSPARRRPARNDLSPCAARRPAAPNLRARDSGRSPRRGPSPAPRGDQPLASTPSRHLPTGRPQTPIRHQRRPRNRLERCLIRGSGLRCSPSAQPASPRSAHSRSRYPTARCPASAPHRSRPNRYPQVPRSRRNLQPCDSFRWTNAPHLRRRHGPSPNSLTTARPLQQQPRAPRPTHHRRSPPPAETRLRHRLSPDRPRTAYHPATRLPKVTAHQADPHHAVVLRAAPSVGRRAPVARREPGHSAAGSRAVERQHDSGPEARPVPAIPAAHSAAHSASVVPRVKQRPVDADGQTLGPLRAAGRRTAPLAAAAPPAAALPAIAAPRAAEHQVAPQAAAPPVDAHPVALPAIAAPQEAAHQAAPQEAGRPDQGAVQRIRQGVGRGPGAGRGWEVGGVGATRGGGWAVSAGRGWGRSRGAGVGRGPPGRVGRRWGCWPGGGVGRVGCWT